MDDYLFETAGSPERDSRLPGRGFFVPDEIEDGRAEREAAEALAGSDVAIVADPDADGLACVALIREAEGEAALIPTGPHELATGLEYVAEFGEPGLTLYVCDLSPDDLDSIEPHLGTICQRSERIRWFDHHQWEPAVADGVRELGVDLVVGDSDEVCTADVALEELSIEYPPHLVELVAVTRDHDLWIRDDERSGDLADYARWSEPEEYIEVIRSHGADLPDEVQELLAERRETKADRIDRAIRRASFHDIGGYTIGVTYGRCSQNEVAEGLRQRGSDAAVIVKPAGSASLRGTETFQRCHEVAALLDGGGHPKAAGCKPPIYEDMLDYAHHWTTEGATTRRVILNAFRDVIGTEPLQE